MLIRTLIIGYIPLTDTIGKKPRQIREDNYFKELLNEFDLGEVSFASYQDWKRKIDEVDPLFVIVFGEYYAAQVKDYKKDALIYVAYDGGQIFYRKAEIEKKKAEQQRKFREIAGLVKQAQEGDEKNLSYMKQFAAMSYNDMYKMIVQAIIGENEDLKKKAWELLTSNNVHSNFIWMRAQLMCEVWDHCDGKGKEEFLCMAMDQHIENGMARKTTDFTDKEGQLFHQYMFRYFDGSDANYIRRIPVGSKGQNKYAYQAILDKYETPNGVQMMLEAGETKSKLEEYHKNEAEKIASLLNKWKTNPELSKRELNVLPTNENLWDEPLIPLEVDYFKNLLKKYDIEKYKSIF